MNNLIKTITFGIAILGFWLNGDAQTLWGWGDNTHGQLGVTQDESTFLSRKSTFVKLVSGSGRYFAFDSVGNVWTAGRNQNGELGIGNYTNINNLVKINNLWNTITCTNTGTIGIRKDSTLWAWGLITEYNSNYSTVVDHHSNKPVIVDSVNKWKDVKCKSGFCIALKNDGSMWGWGYDWWDLIPSDTSTTSDTFFRIRSVNKSNWISFDFSESNVVAVKNDGTLWTWGYGDWNNGYYIKNYHRGKGLDSAQLNSNYGSFNSPVQIGIDSGWKSVIVNGNTSLAENSNGEIYTWGATDGENYYDRKINDWKFKGFEGYRYPTKISNKSYLKKYSIGQNNQKLAIDSSGKLIIWGKFQTGQLGLSRDTIFQQPFLVNLKTPIKDIKINSDNVILTLDKNGRIESLIGDLYDNIPSIVSLPMKVGKENNVSSMVTSGFHSIYSNNRSYLFSVGMNGAGMLGNGNYNNLKRFTNILENKKFKKITVFTDSFYSYYGGTIALTENGELFGCGANLYGEHFSEPGYGVHKYMNLEKFEDTINRWQDVSTNDGFTIAIKSDGTLWGWGKNYYNQLGGNHPSSSNWSYQQFEYKSAKCISQDTNWAKVYAGQGYSFAIKRNGTLWGWGDNSYGQLGVGKNNWSVSVPEQIGVDSNWKSIDFGGSGNWDEGNGLFTVGVKYDGTIWAWGLNKFGQFGIGDSVNTYYFPEKISNDSNWSDISAGYYHIICLNKKGQIFGTGRNHYGQLGLSDKKDRKELTLINNDSNWIAINVSGNSSFAIKSNCLTLQTVSTIARNSDTISSCNSLKLTSKNKKYVSYNWSTGDTTLSSTITQSGLVTLRETDSKGCVNIDTVYVRIIKDELSTAPDTNVCNVKANDTLKLNLSNWFNNSDFYFYDKAKIQTQTADIFIKNSASKKWTGFVSPKNQTSLKCPISGMVYPSVVYPNLLSKTSDTLITIRSLTKPVVNDKKYTKYQWSNGDSTITTSFNASGNYWFKQTDSVGCYQIDTFDFSRINLIIPAKATAKLGSKIVVKVKDSLNTNSQVTWSNGDTGWSTVYTVTKNTDTLYATQSDAYRSVTKFMVITGKAEAIKVSQEDQNKKNDLQDSLLTNQTQTSTNGTALSSDSLLQIQSGNIEIYPNPVTDVLFIEGINCDNRNSIQLFNCHYEIFNSAGQLVQKGNISRTVSVANLITGSYTLKIGNSSYKFIKK
jgi:alpha-tubulin suppressor-like RCC1 family protein